MFLSLIGHIYYVKILKYSERILESFKNFVILREDFNKILTKKRRNAAAGKCCTESKRQV